MNEKGQNKNTPAKNQHAADQRKQEKSGNTQDSFYRKQKEADDAFFERLSENYSAG